jgi:phosphate-selective porin OprO and OprP
MMREKKRQHQTMNSSTLCALAALGAIGSWQAGAAESPSVEERLKRLEDQVQGLTTENINLKKELGYDPKVPFAVVKPAGKEPKITLGGFIQGQAEFGDAPDARFNGVEDRFLLRRARLNVQGSFLEQFDFKLEADFGANSVSETGGYRAQLTDAFLNWNRYELANVKMGQFKSPYGYEQLQSDTRMFTIERSLVNDRLTDGRQIGLGLSGSTFEKRLGYSLGMFNGTSVNNSFNDNDQFMYAGRLSGIPIKTQWNDKEVSWALGINGLSSQDNGTNGPVSVVKPGLGLPGNLFQGDRWHYGVDTQLKVGRFDVFAEYLNAYVKPTSGSSFHADGWYAGATYYFIPKYLQGLVRFETFNPRTSVAGDSTDVWTFGLNYYIKGDDIKLMVNYLLGDRAASGAFEADDNEGRLLTRVQIIF